MANIKSKIKTGTVINIKFFQETPAVNNIEKAIRTVITKTPNELCKIKIPDEIIIMIRNGKMVLAKLLIFAWFLEKNEAK